MPQPSVRGSGRTLDGERVHLLDLKKGLWVRLSPTDEDELARRLQQDRTGLLQRNLIVGLAALSTLAILSFVFERLHWQAASIWLRTGWGKDLWLPLALLGVLPFGLRRAHRIRQFIRQHGRPVDQPVRPDAPRRMDPKGWVVLGAVGLTLGAVAWLTWTRKGDAPLVLLAILTALPVFAVLGGRNVARKRALAAAFDAEHGPLGQEAVDRDR